MSDPGIAHAYMAAEALKGAALMGHTISVETQGAAGAKDTLGDEAVAAADLVILPPTPLHRTDALRRQASL